VESRPSAAFHNGFGSDGLRPLFKSVISEADLKPDEENCTLTVSLHNLTNPLSDRLARHLCEKLNETDTIFPRTNLLLFYKLVSD
jgi:hypothetical protein